MDFTFNLGITKDLSAGLLRVRRDSIDAGVYKRSALQVSELVHESLETVGDKGGLRQIITPMTFVDIVDMFPAEPERGYELRFYHPNPNGTGDPNPNTGEYPVPVTDPIVVWRIDQPTMNPDAGPNTQTQIQPATGSPGQQDLRRLRLTEIRGGIERRDEYREDPTTGALTLVQADGLIQEEELQSVDDEGHPVVTHQVSDATGTSSKVTRTYRKFLWGTAPIKEVRGPGDANLVTLFEYYNDQNDLGSYGQLLYRIDPDGSWVRYGYDEHRRVITELRPWLDEPADPMTAAAGSGRVTQYDYRPVDPRDIGNAQLYNAAMASNILKVL